MAVAECLKESKATAAAQADECFIYAKYMSALAWLVCGKAQDADAALFSIGLRWRLNAHVFASQTVDATKRVCGLVADGLPDGLNTGGSETAQETAAPSTPLAQVHCRDDVLPVELLHRLQQGLEPQSVFWQEHGYGEADCPFFSYLYSLDAKPANAVEETIQHLFAKAAEMNGQDMADVVACEWWAHKRDNHQMWSAGAHQLHFDTDERTFAQDSGVHLTHPVVSSVLYLSESRCPTLITDKVPGSGGLGKQGLLAWYGSILQHEACPQYGSILQHRACSLGTALACLLLFSSA